jgi:hypothetical protein
MASRHRPPVQDDHKTECPNCPAQACSCCASAPSTLYRHAVDDGETGKASQGLCVLPDTVQPTSLVDAYAVVKVLSQ